jgi:hypothetical protein
MEGNTNISKVNQTNSIENNPITNSIQGVIFRNNNISFFIFKKTERIVAALYVISEFLSETEPAKFSIKDIANTLLKETLSLSNTNYNSDQFLCPLLKYFANVSILINLVRDIGSISNMNASILLEEINKVVEILLKIWPKIDPNSKTFNSNFFATGIDIKEDDFDNYPFLKNTIVNGDSFRNTTNNQKDIKDNVLYNAQKKTTGHSSHPVKDKNNRQEIIIAMLKKDKILTIKDFSVRIKDCSEKTIQRELMTLMAKGVLKKEGERRWSKYFLI